MVPIMLVGERWLLDIAENGQTSWNLIKWFKLDPEEDRRDSRNVEIEYMSHKWLPTPTTPQMPVLGRWAIDKKIATCDLVGGGEPHE